MQLLLLCGESWSVCALNQVLEGRAWLPSFGELSGRVERALLSRRSGLRLARAAARLSAAANWIGRLIDFASAKWREQMDDSSANAQQIAAGRPLTAGAGQTGASELAAGQDEFEFERK